MKRAFPIILLAIASLLIPQQAQSAAQAKAGAKCTKVNSTQTVGAKKFTCVKSGSRMVWNKGVTVAKSTTPTPIPTQSADVIAPVESFSPSAALIKFKNCTEAKAAGATPLNKAVNPELYEINSGLDRDKDGIACE
jgi:hypothetical protein